ncbi:carbonic anhydrase [Lichenibacterium minor]|jgi:carbonic anhydrase|uniref:Carbonic anhydrase n=1 Tax=Lichenibacterium minor TaxID=2316528 RepID=A0A4Q2TYG2_9HYPH|nr:carbonic anhydrase [Lichenibacterium minor]RYC29152.1 carbonic anhydrase [Lichenibacterium minor]
MPGSHAAPPSPVDDDPVERLFDGVREFRDNVFPERREQFEQLAKAQNPRILFITCADSRVVPEMITQTEPGELFVCRNIGNIVPAYGEMMGGVSAVVEYAVVALGVTDIVVCGHSNCGAMAGLIRGDEALNKMPTVRSWLRNAHAARSVVEVLHPELDGDDKIQALVEQNVVTQLQHLGTHPTVAAGVASGKLELHGWVYDIETGAIHLHDAAQGRMVPFEESQGNQALKRKAST